MIAGDNLSCFNEKFKGWLEVEVVEIDNDGKRYKMIWVGNNNLPSFWIPMNSNKLSIRHKKHV